MLLGSIGEAVHHQINCLRCGGSHGGQDSESFGFVEKEVCGPSTTMLSRGYLKVFELLADVQASHE
jgi:hypothetical protein